MRAEEKCSWKMSVVLVAAAQGLKEVEGPWKSRIQRRWKGGGKVVEEETYVLITTLVGSTARR